VATGSGAGPALRPVMITPTPTRLGAIAAVSVLTIAGCAPGTLGVSPETILSAVIANIPVSTTTDGGRPAPAPARRRIPESPPPSAQATRVLRSADSYVGVKYVWGGNTPSGGFDCSGFTKYIFAKYGVALPRTSREQARAGRAVAADFGSLRPGDLMLFAEPDEAISHVAIYVGNGRIIHSSSAVGGVGYTDLNTGGDWFVAYFVAARRVL
jgi:cell wall-associated NlpC family hydrolase